MIPSSLDADPCLTSEQWGISLELSKRLRRAATRVEALGLGVLLIISGLRTELEQLALERAGRPTAPMGRSTHTSCPATGADVWNANVDQTDATDGIKLAIVVAMEAEGLRVGGGGPIRSNGLPVDWNHADLGPRPTST